MHKCRRKSNVEIMNEELKGNIIEVEYIGIHKCKSKIQVGIINE